MNKVLLAGVALLALASTPAMAADMPVKVKAPVVPPYDWTGCYIGGQGGGLYGLSTHTDLYGPYAGYDLTPNFETSGAIAGGTVGCNYQVGPWVYGVEGDYSWTDLKGTTPNINSLFPNESSETKQTWIGTARVRFGYAWDAQKDGTAGIIYITGGVAGADTEVVGCVLATCLSASQTRTGWTVGGGLEVPIYRTNWTFKFDFMYLDFGKSEFFNPVVTEVEARNVKVTESIVRIGVNYRFAWWDAPQPVRY
jgi:outer membrane immunogenic protein